MDNDDGTLFELPSAPMQTVPFAAPARLADLMDPGWAKALAPAEPALHRIAERLEAEQSAGTRILPAAPDILRAFRQPLAEVKVLIVGQDPYPTPGHAVGLAFAVDRAVRPLPRSLANIYQELREDTGAAPAAHGDLSAWAGQGVLLLNRVLTVRAGDAGSHRGIGWEAISELAVRALVARGTALVSILWGRDAHTLVPLLGDTARIESAHPSPLSARRGFFGSRPFSRANTLLAAQGAAPVDWTLPSDASSGTGVIRP